MSALLANHPSLAGDEFRLIADLAYEVCGVVLTDDKRTLVINRLSGVLGRRGVKTFGEYHRLVKGDRSGKLVSEFVNCISTNHTFFNREPAHFDFYERVALPEAIRRSVARNVKKLRIWCAACSTGQEAYMLAMSTMKVLAANYRNWDAGVLATDVNDDVLATTRRGEYPADQLVKLPRVFLPYFKRTSTGTFVVTEALRKELTVRRFNLMNEHYKFRDPFDVIFVRNVMIYFDESTRLRIAARMFGTLRAGGYVFVGSAESFPKGHPFQQVAAGVYRRGG